MVVCDELPLTTMVTPASAAPDEVSVTRPWMAPVVELWARASVVDRPAPRRAPELPSTTASRILEVFMGVLTGRW